MSFIDLEYNVNVTNFNFSRENRYLAPQTKLSLCSVEMPVNVDAQATKTVEAV